MSKRLLVAGVLLLGVLAAQMAHANASIRKFVAAGAMYPEKADDIVKAMNRFYEQVTYTPPQEKLLACVVPHSAWGFCGQIAAAGLKELNIGQYERVIVLAPSHASGFEGCSIPAVEGFTIPIGVIPLDGKSIGKLNYSALVTLRGVNYQNNKRRPLHETEYSVENILPFVLERVGPFFLVPILVGDLKELDGRLSPQRIEAVAETISSIVDDKTLIVVSTDFTHYGNDFSFRPFNTDIQQNIEKLDRQAFELVMNRDFEGFLRYLEKTNNPICGQAALLILMKLLPPQARGVLIDYTQSQMKTKNQDRSVSYAAINFYDPTQPPRPAVRQIAPVAAEITGVTQLPPSDRKPLEAAPAPAPEEKEAAPAKPERGKKPEKEGRKAKREREKKER